jgi:hypothetical protein
MAIKYYRYPRSIQAVKAISKIQFFFFPSLMLFAAITSWLYPTQTYVNWSGLIFGSIFFSSFFIFIAYSFPDVGISEEGLRIEFLWSKISVPWNKVIAINPLPTHIFRVWLVKTDELTLFHRLYGLYYGLSIKPCFAIHSTLRDHLELTQEIRKQIRISKHRKPGNEDNGGEYDHDYG